MRDDPQSDDEIISLSRRRHLQRRIAALAFALLAGVIGAMAGEKIGSARHNHVLLPSHVWWPFAAAIALVLIGLGIALYLLRPPRNAYSDRLVRKRLDELQWQIRRYLGFTPLVLLVFASTAEFATQRLIGGNVTFGNVLPVVIFLNFALLSLLMLSPYAARRSARRAMNDELTSALRARALSLGFWVLVLCMAVIFVLALFDRKLAIEGMVPALYLATAVPAARFAYLDWRAGREQ